MAKLVLAQNAVFFLQVAALVRQVRGGLIQFPIKSVNFLDPAKQNTGTETKELISKIVPRRNQLSSMKIGSSTEREEG